MARKNAAIAHTRKSTGARANRPLPWPAQLALGVGVGGACRGGARSLRGGRGALTCTHAARRRGSPLSAPYATRTGRPCACCSTAASSKAPPTWTNGGAIRPSPTCARSSAPSRRRRRRFASAVPSCWEAAGTPGRSGRSPAIRSYASTWWSSTRRSRASHGDSSSWASSWSRQGSSHGGLTRRGLCSGLTAVRRRQPGSG